VQRPQRRTFADQAPSSVAENIRAIIELETASLRRRSVGERLGDWVAARAGSVTFALIHLVWFAAWIVGNVGLIPGLKPFDPYPFGFLTFVVSLEAIYLSIFVLVSQNRLSRQAEIRAHLDLQVNLLAEQETTTTLRLVKRICDRLGIEPNQEDDAEGLMARTDVNEIISELEGKLPGSTGPTNPLIILPQQNSKTAE
jgi:uncharacterized membrane protein